MWYVPQRVRWSLPRLTTGLGLVSRFILKRKDLLEGDVCILYVTIVHARH